MYRRSQRQSHGAARPSAIVIKTTRHPFANVANHALATLSRTLLLLSSSCVLTHGCCLFQSDGRRVEGVPRSQRCAYMACATVLTAAATCSDALACALSCRVMRDGSGNDIERVTSCMLCFAMHAPRFLGVEEDSAASCKVHSRVRHFGGVFATPVHKHSICCRIPYASWRAREPNRHQHDRMTEAAHARNIGRH